MLSHHLRLRPNIEPALVQFLVFVVIAFWMPVNVGSMLAHHLRRRPNIEPALVQFLVFVGIAFWMPVNVGSMLAHHLRRRPNTEPGLVQCLVFAGIAFRMPVLPTCHIVVSPNLTYCRLSRQITMITSPPLYPVTYSSPVSLWPHLALYKY